jgi:TPR repeat protein
MTTLSEATAIEIGFKALSKNEHSAAREAFERAVREGTGDSALIHLGWLLEQGLGGTQDVSRAMMLYRQALEAGAPEPAGLAAYHLGLLLMKQGDSIESSALLQRAADAGNPSAAYWLYASYTDAGDPASTRLADQALQRAATLGHAYALRDLARRRMRSNTGFFSKFKALLDYWKAKATGVALTIRNVDDWRVR